MGIVVRIVTVNILVRAPSGGPEECGPGKPYVMRTKRGGIKEALMLSISLRFGRKLFRFLLAQLLQDLQLLDMLLTSHLHRQAQFEPVQCAWQSGSECFYLT